MLSSSASSDDLEDKQKTEDTKRSVKDSIRHVARAPDKPRQWIYDRCNGKEQVMDPNHRPCCFLLYPNGLLKLLPGMFASSGV